MSERGVCVAVLVARDRRAGLRGVGRAGGVMAGGLSVPRGAGSVGITEVPAEQYLLQNGVLLGIFGGLNRVQWIHEYSCRPALALAVPAVVPWGSSSRFRPCLAPEVPELSAARIERMEKSASRVGVLEAGIT